MPPLICIVFGILAGVFFKHVYIYPKCEFEPKIMKKLAISWAGFNFILAILLTSLANLSFGSYLLYCGMVMIPRDFINEKSM
jgi:hypothetical protein